jgi:hypothetical protein
VVMVDDRAKDMRSAGHTACEGCNVRRGCWNLYRPDVAVTSPFISDEVLTKGKSGEGRVTRETQFLFLH